MASHIYKPWKQEIMQGTASALLSGTGATGVYAAIVDTAVYSAADTEAFFDEGGANDAIDGLVGTAVELTSKTFVNGLFDAADTTFTAVTGASVEAIVIYVKNAGAATTHRLVAYIDGVSVTPNGGNIVVNWSASGIFQL